MYSCWDQDFMRLNYIMVVKTKTFWDSLYLQLLRPKLSETMNLQSLETETNRDWTKVVDTVHFFRVLLLLVSAIATLQLTFFFDWGLVISRLQGKVVCVFFTYLLENFFGIRWSLHPRTINMRSIDQYYAVNPISRQSGLDVYINNGLASSRLHIMYSMPGKDVRRNFG